MKRLLVAVILAVVITLTLASPVFAGDPPDNKPGNMPESSIPPEATENLEHARDSMLGLAYGGGYGPVVANVIIYRMINAFWAFGQWIDPQIPGIYQRWIFPNLL